MLIFQDGDGRHLGDIVEKMYLNMILAALVRKSIFKNGIGGP